MRFTPKDESELSKLLQPGEYDLEITEAEDTVVKGTDREQIKLRVAVWDGDRIRARIFDYLNESVAYKIRHICEATGQMAKYESGELKATDLLGKMCKGKIVIEKDKKGQYPDKNKIQDYLKGAVNRQPSEQTNPFDEPPVW